MSASQKSPYEAGLAFGEWVAAIPAAMEKAGRRFGQQLAREAAEADRVVAERGRRQLAATRRGGS